MSVFFNAYFLKTQKPQPKIKEKFSKFERIPNSDWLICDFGNSYADGAFGGEGYLTQELSEIFGEVVFIAIDTMNNQLDYERSVNGEIVRKLAWLSDGSESTWCCVEGQLEDWEIDAVFSAENLRRTMDLLSYDDHLRLLPQEQLEAQEQELQRLWQSREYILNRPIPWCDATLGLVIQKHFFGITSL